MNDYERAEIDIRDAINETEAIDPVDPDIEHEIDMALTHLNAAIEMAKDRA